MDRLRALFQQVADFFAALPPARRVSFAALTLAVVAGTLALAWWVQRPQYRVLFANLGSADAGSIIEYLKTERIPYRVEAGGTSIAVPVGQVYETRLALAGRGVPQGGGVGFEIFDKQTLGMTDFVQRLNYQRALQGELARTIAELDVVDSARVHLALPERSLFVAEDRRPSASVVVKLRAGRVLGQEQIAGIVHLVAASVEGLKPVDVTVVDVNGQVLTRELEEASSRPPGQAVMGLQREVEQRYGERIESMLERVLGPGHALARVSVTLDLAQVEQTEESYDPDRVAVRNEKRSRESNQTANAASGVPGVTATLTNEPVQPEAPNGPTSEREDAALTYEISRTTSRRIEAMGGIEKLSVAVLLDGTWAGEGDARVFKPRPAEEIDRYRDIIKSAVGFNEERGDQIEVASVPFETGTTLEVPETPGMLARIGAWSGWSDVLWRAAGLVVVLVLILTVIRPFLLAMASRAPVTPPERALESGRVRVSATAEPAALPPSAVPALGMLDAARRNPEQAAHVIRQWIGGAETS